MNKMTTLDLKKLTSYGSDWESNQYKILIKVKEWSLNFNKNKLFPSIEEAIQLNLALEDLLRENIECKLWFDNEIKGRKINERVVVYEKAHQVGHQLDKLLTFIDWALQLNRPVLEEGRIIKNFVEENIRVKRVSRSEKNYHGKGYFSLPDNKNQILNIYLYEIIWDWTQENLYQRLTSNLVRTIPLKSIGDSVEEMMYNFISYSKDMHEPVAFVLQTELDFPYNETIFPIAEEKLLKHLSH
ncbi:MAG: hypothetical protein DAHOPDDO_03129 [Ignavibacteriaceae bacterium]|jgi:hypothetical protein|nr:hypothetical protein [Ignavibacteriaceae bacterium]GIK62183.1 MAG: hypothetical protein BroJett017_30730 [Ignavibacteriota bacterium]